MQSPTLQHLSERAERHVEAGNWDAARKDWQDALAIVPGSAEVMLELSYVESLSGHYRLARDWALRAANAGPSSNDALVSVVHRLRTFNEIPVLRTMTAQLMADERTPVGVLVECARQLSNLNDFDLALQCADAATVRAPADLAARLVRGQLLAHHGRVNDAAVDINWVLQRQPGISIAWWMLSRLHKQTSQSNHIAPLRALLQTPGLRPPDVAALARALHKELDDVGDHEGAWQALELLCRVKRPTEQYDSNQNRKLMEGLLAWRPDEVSPPVPQAAGRVPVFIVGMYRSGTTLMEQLLDASPHVRGLGELTDFSSAMRYATDHYCRGAIDQGIIEHSPGIDLAEVGQRYLDGVAWRLGDERFFTDKLPSNGLNIGFICRALPHAKILHMVRDPVETCFSNLRELFTEVNPFSYDQHELADHYIQYRRLMSHWHAMFPGRILDVDYARLTRDTAGVMREVATFCGLEYIDAMSDPRSSNRAVATASAVQVREGVVWRKRPKWAPYARQLQPLITALRQGGIEVPELPA